MRTDVFRPVTLRGEFKLRSSKQCAGFSSGFVYTVRDRSHLSPSHRQHDPDLCADDTMSSGLFSDDQLLKEHLVSSVHLFLVLTWMPTQRWKVECWSQRFGGESPSQSALICRNSWSIAPTSGPRWMCATRSAGDAGPSGTFSTQLHRSLAKRQRPRREERRRHDQPKSRTDCPGCLYQGERGRCMSEVGPRTSCLQHCFGTDSALPWTESRRNTAFVAQSVPQRCRRPWRVEEYQPCRRWKFSEWFWWPRNTPKTRRWQTGSTSCKRLDGSGASSGGKPSLGTGTVRSVATARSTVSASSISTPARGRIDNGSLASASRGRRIH